MSDYVEAISFAFSEIKRFAELDRNEWRKLALEDIFSSIPSGDGCGSFMCGQKAHEALMAIVEKALLRSGYQGQIDARATLDDLKTIIAERFIHRGDVLNERSASRAVSAAVKRVARSILPITHFIPCNIADDAEPAEFSIGRVKFERTEVCLKRLGEEVALYKQKYSGEPEVGGWLINETLNYYKGFNWIAQVLIEDCDAPSSLARASQFVSAALDFLYVRLSACNSQHLRVGGFNLSNELHGAFGLRNGEISDVRLTRHWNTRKFGSDWWEEIGGSRGSEFMSLVGPILERALNPKERTPLAVRLVDAARWYGDATRETFAESRLIKFVISMERILTTKNGSEVSKRLCERGSALICFPRIDKVAEERRRLARAYKLRSRFVHGSAPLSEFKLRNALLEVQESARCVIWSALLLFSKDGAVLDKSISSKQLEKGYDWLVAWAKGDGTLPPLPERARSV